MSFFLDLWVVPPNKKMSKKGLIGDSKHSDVFLMDIAKNSYGMENPVIDRKTDHRNRPKIIENSGKKARQNLYASVSHSDDWSFFVFCTNDVGIDTEWFDYDKQPKKTDIMGISKRYFSEQEVKILENQGEYEKMATFFQWWTIKEAYIKCAGLKLLTGIKTSTQNIPYKWTWQYFLFDRENLKRLCKTQSTTNSSQKLALTIMWEGKNQTESIGINIY